MLEKGTRIKVKFPKESEGFKNATVLHCSTQGRRCKVALGEEQETRTIDLNKCEYHVFDEEFDDDGAQPSSPSDAVTAQADLDIFAQLQASSEGIDRLSDIISDVDPDTLLQSSNEVSDVTKLAVKEVIDYSLMDVSVPQSSMLSKFGFYVDGFDAEQIWLQLDSISKTALRHIKRTLHRCRDVEAVIPEDVEDALDELLEIQTENGLDEGAPGEDSGEDYSSETNESHEDGDMSGGEEEEEEEEDSVARGMQSIEDEHLNLDDMEAFLEEAEDIQARENDPELGDSSEEEALDTLLDDMMNTKSGKTSGKRLSETVDHSSDPLSNAKYEDFFGPKKSSKKAVHFSNDTKEDTDRRNIDEQESEPDSGDDDFHDDQFEDDQESDQDEDDTMPSRHQMRLEKVSSKIQRLEEEALGEKDWFMKGEVSASHRPKNSALEIDLDFETTMKPPPQPTEETTKSLEDIIKRRIADHKFDDVIAIVPSTEDRKKTTVELDDVKSSQGLGEIYENEYLSSRMGGTSEDKDEPIRELAKKQFIALCARLDQLSHGQYKPVPSIEDVTFKVDVPAIMMEEATPAFVSDASMRKPEEVYKLGQSLRKSVAVEDDEGEEKVITTREGMIQAEGVAKSEAELTREDRKRRRAAKKRAAKKRKMSRDADQVQRALATGKTAILGRKSEAAAQMLRKLSSSSTPAGSSGVNFTKSREVFARMNELKQQQNNPPASKAKPDVQSRHLKL